MKQNESYPQTGMSAEDSIRRTADKVSEALLAFLSSHEADELTRIITDPSKGVEDVKACLDVIRQQNLHEQMRDRITSAMLIPGEDCRVFISAQIDGKLMPRKELTEADVQLMGSEDLGALNETSFAEKVKGLALTYYKDVLSLPPVELVDAEEVMQPLTRDDLHSYMELEQALQKKFPEGLTLQVPQLTTDELFNYIIYDKFHDDNLRLAGIGEQVPPSEETLQAEVHIPADKLGYLIPSPEVYNDDSYSYAINDFEVQDVCEAGVSELMHKHPDLQGAVLDADKWLLVKYMRVEGRPLDACLAWILQDCKLDVQQLKHLMNDTALAEQKLANIRKAGFSDYDRQRLEKIGSPKLLDMTHNRNYIYFHEKGTLGFAVVDRARGVTYSGETLSRAAQDFINDFASNKNLQVGGHHTFFLMPGVNSEKRAYLDTMKEKLVLADIQQNAYGGVMTTDGMKVLKEGDMQHFQDITGRVTDARIIGIDKPMVRCKIDGEQQMARPLGKSDIIRCGHFMTYSDEMKSFALSMAVKHFAKDLCNDLTVQQTRGFKR